MNIFRLLATINLFATISFSAASAAITVTEAKIDAGTMKVSGTSTTGTHVSLDGLHTAPVVGGSFSFNVVYHAEACIVRLTSVPPGSVRDAVVADCGPRGVIPRGTWVSTRAYALNNLVIHAGSSWRAKQAVPPGTVPGASGSGASWEKFAAKGATGAIGATGATGPAGPGGPAGADGAAGPAGADGAVGPRGARGPPGPAGAGGAVATFLSNGSIDGSLHCLGNLNVAAGGFDSPCLTTATTHTFQGESTLLVGPMPAGGATVTNLLATVDGEPIASETNNPTIDVVDGTDNPIGMFCTINSGNVCTNAGSVIVAAGTYLQVRITNNGDFENRAYRVTFRY